MWGSSPCSGILRILAGPGDDPLAVLRATDLRERLEAEARERQGDRREVG